MSSHAVRDACLVPSGTPCRDLTEGRLDADDRAELLIAAAEQRARFKAARGEPLTVSERRVLRLTWGPAWESLLIPGVEPKPPTEADRVRAWKAANRERLREQQRRYRARKKAPGTAVLTGRG